MNPWTLTIVDPLDTGHPLIRFQCQSDSVACRVDLDYDVARELAADLIRVADYGEKAEVSPAHLAHWDGVRGDREAFLTAGVPAEVPGNIRPPRPFGGKG